MKTCTTPLRALIAVFLICAAALVSAESGAVSVDSIGKPEGAARFSPLFPHALTQAGAVEISENRVGAVASFPAQNDTAALDLNVTRLQSVFLNNDVFALYGKPGAYTMGILGQYSLPAIEPVMNEFIAKYDAANGDRGIIPSFYIIFGTCWPEGEIGYLSDSVIRQYIEFAAQRGWYVFLDHQIGKYSVESAVKRLLPYLQYPNDQLAMQEIGSVTADEVNIAQKMIQDYMIEHGLPGRRMLVIHQFKPKMIMNRRAVRSDFELVQLIHCADGFGSPTLKKSTYALNAEATNIPIKSFKLFLKPTVAGAGYDQPLMTPDEVFQLNPRPYLIMYQ